MMKENSRTKNSLVAFTSVYSNRQRELEMHAAKVVGVLSIKNKPPSFTCGVGV